MRIASVETFIHTPQESDDSWFPRKPLGFVRVTTRDGIAGWGEIHPITHRVPAICTLARALGDHIAGSPVHDIKAIVHQAFYAFGEQRIGIEVYAALSAIEIACWDIVAKDAGHPVYRLIGGSCHPVIPLYANIYSRQPRSAAELAQRAEEMAVAGFRAIKFYPFVGGISHTEAIEKVRSVREAVGPNIELGVDLWRGHTPDEARTICRSLEPFNLAWVEEPISPLDPAAYAALRTTVAQPLVTGESLAGAHAFRDLIEQRAVGIVNPDVCVCGGILELRSIAAMADVRQILVAPHNANSMTVGLAATLHTAAGIPNLQRCEYFPEWEADLDAICDTPIRPVDGACLLPEQPGIGLDLDPTHLTPCS